MPLGMQALGEPSSGHPQVGVRPAHISQLPSCERVGPQPSISVCASGPEHLLLQGQRAPSVSEPLQSRALLLHSRQPRGLFPLSPRPCGSSGFLPRSVLCTSWCAPCAHPAAAQPCAGTFHEQSVEGSLSFRTAVPAAFTLRCSLLDRALPPSSVPECVVSVCPTAKRLRWGQGRTPGPGTGRGGAGWASRHPANAPCSLVLFPTATLGYN